MSVFRKKGSPYYHFDFQFQGQRFCGSTGCTAKTAAREFERRERQKAAVPDQQLPMITLDEACGLYQDKVEDMPSWPTIKYMLSAMIIGLGAKIQLAEINQRSLQTYFRQRRRGRAPSSTNREVENARAVWRHAEEMGYCIGRMPNWKALRLKDPERPARELSIDEEARLFEHLRADVSDAVDFLLKSGWRRAEVLVLQWSDCDLVNLTAVTRIKGGDVVRRPLTRALKQIIERQPQVGPYVFTYVCQKSRSNRRKGHRYPLTPTALRRPFNAALENAGIGSFRLHDLRHTRGTRIVRETGSLAAAKEALKHKSIATTLRYAHVLDDDTRRALEASESRNSPERTRSAARKLSKNQSSSIG